MAILASLLLPALSRAKDKTRNVVCMRNERQIWLGYRLALEEDAGESLGKRSVGEWYLRTMGDPNQGWICPVAPLQNTNGPFPTGDWSTGSVNAPWWW